MDESNETIKSIIQGYEKKLLMAFLKYWTDKYCEKPYDDEMIEHFIDIYLNNIK